MKFDDTFTSWVSWLLPTLFFVLPTMLAAAELPPPGIDGPSQRVYQMAKMRRAGILDHRNLPYQLYCDREYFRVVETKYVVGDVVHIKLVTKVRQRGIEFLRRKFAPQAALAV